MAYITPEIEATFPGSLNKLLQGDDFKIELAPGIYNISTPLDIITKPKHILGASMSMTCIKDTYTEYKPTLDLSGTGSIIENIAIVDGHIRLLSVDDNASPDFSVLRNVYITGNTPAAIRLLLDGTNRATGIRDIRLDNVLLFSATCAFSFLKAVNILATGLNCFGTNGGKSIGYLYKASPINLSGTYLRNLRIKDSPNVIYTYPSKVKIL